MIDYNANEEEMSDEFLALNFLRGFAVAYCSSGLVKHEDTAKLADKAYGEIVSALEQLHTANELLQKRCDKLINQQINPPLINLGGKWTTIDSAPKDGRFILSWHKDGGRPEITRWINNHWTRWAIEPSHWMPLPCAPQMEGE